MLNVIFAGLAVIGFIGWVTTLGDENRTAKVGDVFVHANPGNGVGSPDEKPDPFCVIYRVTEIRNGKAHVVGYSQRLSSTSNTPWDHWESLNDCGRFDKKVLP